MHLKELQTERLLLKKFTPEFYKIIFEEYTIAEQLEALSLDSEVALKKEKEKYEKGISTYKWSFIYFKLLDKITGLFIGSCGFHIWYTEHFRAEIGYDIIQESYKNQGYMTEALQVVIPFGFDILKLKRIEALVEPNNSASSNLLKKFGFVEEGYMREHYYKNNEMQDSVIYSLLAREFAKP